MSKSETEKNNEDNSKNSESANEVNEDKSILNDSAEKAIEEYRKMRENTTVDLTEKQITEIDKECEIIRNREIITQDIQHIPIEITTKNDEIVTGPPTLTRFEKARIMGARALQLSLGAPVFIELPKEATTSLEIAMEELKERVIPIVIRRILPNSDYQNISIDKFA